MIKEFVDKIAQNSTIAIFGAGICGRGLKKYIDENRKDIKIAFFVDTYQTGILDGLNIINFADLEEYKNQFDLLVYATTKVFWNNEIIFDFLNIKTLCVPVQLEQYFRLEKHLQYKNEVLDIFKDAEDKELYNLLWEARLSRNSRKIEDYVFEKHNINSVSYYFAYNKQYFEYINQDAIEVIIEGGVFNGVTALSFVNNFKNLKKIYGFDPMYENFKNPIYDKYIQRSGKIKIIPLGLWHEDDELTFVENTKIGSSSRVAKDENLDNDNIIIHKINVTSIDNFKNKNNLKKIDYIKLDIEGAEQKALEGALETIQKDRPQLAISIYHSLDDFVNIPRYLSKKLENYTFKLGQYSCLEYETILYAIPNELYNQ